MIIFKLQHRKTYHFAVVLENLSAISSSQKLLKIDSYTFITQVGDPALKHTRAIRHYSNYFPWEHLLSLQGGLPLEAAGVAGKRPCFMILLAKLFSAHLHTPVHEEMYSWIPTPTAVWGTGDGNSSSLTARIPSRDTAGSSRPSDTSVAPKPHQLQGSWTRRPLHPEEQKGPIQDHH